MLLKRIQEYFAWAFLSLFPFFARYRSSSSSSSSSMAAAEEAMDLLRSQLARVRIPEPSNRIYKQECCISFDTPRSEGGLFVDLCSFLAFGKDYVMWQFKKSGNPVYLNIKEIPKSESEDRPHKKPTLLAIGMDGGFNSKEPDFEVSYKIVILPQFAEVSFPNVDLPEKVRLAVDGVLSALGAERKEQVEAWTLEKKQTSIYAYDLVQLDNGVTIPPTGWKCAKCDMTENLWLNLTDGMILCGRRNWDGSGGNNHALEHYEETRYPLSVKLGTITADLESTDVYSYAEDETVEDPLLAQHLAHFGIEFTALKKTEMTTAERELDQNVNFDWNRIQESGKELQPIFGPGYTGLTNLGNSCYLASIMQVVFSTRDFPLRYFENIKLDEAFQLAPSDPTVDLNMQLTKLAHGLLSGKYSSLEKKVNDGIPPRMFKSLIGARHPEFGSARQQDALEFFQYFLDQVEQTHVSNTLKDPSHCFKFLIEERILCSSSRKVKYTKRCDNFLSLTIPLESAVNKDEFSAFLKRKAEVESAGLKLNDEEIVRPRVPLSACLEHFSASEEVPEFYSSAIKAKTTAIKSTRLATFPDCLVLHMRKFVMDAGWVPRKLDVFLEMPDVLDINVLRSKGIQPNEELLPETDDCVEDGPRADESIVAQLSEMGFPQVRCEKAAIKTTNSGVDAAMEWLLSHMDDPDIDVPLGSDGENSKVPSVMAIDESAVETLVSFGFDPQVARKALKETAGDVERAAEWVFAHPEVSTAMDVDDASHAAPAVSEKDFSDGSGKYRLVAFVSHMGTSTQCGHYVAHILKEGRWVIFNDCKVALSGDAPKDMGYLYFYERVPS